MKFDLSKFDFAWGRFCFRRLETNDLVENTRWKKKVIHQNFISSKIFWKSFDFMNIIISYLTTLISRHRIVCVNHCLQSFEHLDYFSIDEILRNRVSFIKYQFFDDDLVLIKKFSNIILRRQSTIFNEIKIR
jgi:hypothetical protein